MPPLSTHIISPFSTPFKRSVFPCSSMDRKYSPSAQCAVSMRICPLCVGSSVCTSLPASHWYSRPESVAPIVVRRIAAAGSCPPDWGRPSNQRHLWRIEIRQFIEAVLTEEAPDFLAGPEILVGHADHKTVLPARYVRRR